MVDLIDEAFRLQTFLEVNQCRFCFIGGLAVQHWGEPRLTRYIDVSLLTGFSNEGHDVLLLLDGYAQRIEDAGAFALAHRVLLLRTAGGIGIDISLAALPFEELVIQRAVPTELVPSKALRLCSAEDLIISKLFAGREIDLRDARSVVVRQGEGRLDWNYIETHLAELGDLKEDPGLVDQARAMRRPMG